MRLKVDESLDIGYAKETVVWNIEKKLALTE